MLFPSWLDEGLSLVFFTGTLIRGHPATLWESLGWIIILILKRSGRKYPVCPSFPPSPPQSSLPPSDLPKDSRMPEDIRAQLGCWPTHSAGAFCLWVYTQRLDGFEKLFGLFPCFWWDCTLVSSSHFELREGDPMFFLNSPFWFLTVFIISHHSEPNGLRQLRPLFSCWILALSFNHFSSVKCW